MIETYNNLIFWLGYLVVAGVLLSLALVIFYWIFKKLMGTKTFFNLVIILRYENMIKALEEEDFYKWHKELEQWYKQTQKDK